MITQVHCLERVSSRNTTWGWGPKNYSIVSLSWGEGGVRTGRPRQVEFTEPSSKKKRTARRVLWRFAEDPLQVFRWVMISKYGGKYLRADHEGSHRPGNSLCFHYPEWEILVIHRHQIEYSKVHCSCSGRKLALQDLLIPPNRSLKKNSRIKLFPSNLTEPQKKKILIITRVQNTQ